MGTLAASLKTGLDLLLPRLCVACENNEGEDFCGHCRAKILPLTAGICCFCRRPFATMESGVCPSCSTRLDLSKLFIATRYDDLIMKPVVHALKYGGITSLAQILAQLIRPLLAAARAAREIPRTLLTVPIPLPPLRWRTRGYNQTALIADALRSRPIGDLTLIPAYGALGRHWSFAQANLSAHFREENIANAFNTATNLGDSDVLLVDDVCTTGATLAAAAAALHSAGARRIFACAVAKG